MSIYSRVYNDLVRMISPERARKQARLAEIEQECRMGIAGHPTMVLPDSLLGIAYKEAKARTYKQELAVFKRVKAEWLIDNSLIMEYIDLRD